MTISIGVLAPRESWHFQDLKRAAETFNREIQLRRVDFNTLTSQLEDGKESFSDRYGSIAYLDALIVRTMPPGSLQQIIFRMDVLHRLAKSGVRVFNSPRSVEIAIDKYLSLSLMAEAGIAVPDTSVCQSRRQAASAFQDLGRDVILKPIFGSMGKHVKRISSPEELHPAMDQFMERGEVFYLQKFVPHNGTDIRILIVGKSVFSMKRVNPKGGWLTNIAQGAHAEPYTPSQREIDLALRAAKANRCVIAGVDIVYEQASGIPMVLEVNASPGWEGIQKVCEGDVANSVLQAVTTNLG